jgi:hypothetical protein
MPPDGHFRGWHTGLQHKLPEVGATEAAAHLRAVGSQARVTSPGPGAGRVLHQVRGASRRAFGEGLAAGLGRG